MKDMVKKVCKTTTPRDGWADSTYRSTNDAFEELYLGLNKENAEVAPRGQKIRETLGCDIYILNPIDNVVYNSHRLTSPYYLAQEHFWYLSGDRNVDSISKYSAFWKKLADDNGMINSNYGAYIFDKNYYPINGMSQWEYLIDTLKKDPDSRQAILQIPITPTKGSKDMCCTSSLQFFIRKGKLNMTTYMRSNDLVLGFCNDITFFTNLQLMLAVELGVELGWYRHCVGSLHVYERHFIENSGREFWHEVSSYEYSKNLKLELEGRMKDYEILKDRKKDGLINPVYKYMADNFDNK